MNDVMLFGATGCVGGHIFDYLMRVRDAKMLTVAVCGRNHDALQALVNDRAAKNVAVYVADLESPESLEDVAKLSIIMINAAGPYQPLAHNLIRACIASGCHYIDVCHEIDFLYDLRTTYDKTARIKSVYVLSGCGFKTVISQLGIEFCLEQFQNTNDGAAFRKILAIDSFQLIRPVDRPICDGIWRTFVRSLITRTIRTKRRQIMTGFAPQGHSAIICDMVTSTDAADLAVPDYIAMTANRSNTVPAYYRAFIGDPPLTKVLMAWTVFFPINIAIQCILLTLLVLSIYYMDSSSWAILRCMLVVLAIVIWISVNWAVYNSNSVLIRYPGFFSWGLVRPKDDDTEPVQFQTFFRCQISDESVRWARVFGPDPDTIVTAVCVVEATLCVLKERTSMPPGGGVFSPRVAFGNTKLAHRLSKHGSIAFQALPAEFETDADLREKIFVDFFNGPPPSLTEHYITSPATFGAKSTDDFGTA